MSFLFRLVYAAHASGSHHKIALRAVEAMRAAEAEGWRRLMLSRAPRLLEGAKAPDKAFKDFQNHVLHPAAGPDASDWGGAPAAAAEWYDRLVDDLERRRWDEAVYAAGVLSHYVSDPMMPLHTGSSEAETKMHRGAEWSVSRDFEALWSAAPREETAPAALNSEEWLDALVRRGARDAHAEYAALIAGYDVARGAKTPEQGFDAVGREIIARQLARAVRAVAFSFDRAVAEAGMAPPRVDLTARTVLATFGAPIAWVARKLDDAADRAEARRIAAEIAETGELKTNLPRECAVVQSARAADLATPPPPRHVARPRRRRLERASPVVDAPSIGPKTAARLQALGVETVADLLAADPRSVADGLGDRRIAAPTVAAWRDQAALLVRLPRLRRAEAVLLVASGYRDVAAVATADAVRLRDQLLATAKSPAMRRVLRSAIAPDLAEVRRVVEAAREVEAGL